MKKGQLPKAQPLRVLKPKQKQPTNHAARDRQGTTPNNVRAKQRMDEYIQRYHKALYNNGLSDV